MIKQVDLQTEQFERSLEAFTPNGKRQIQVENFSG